MATSSAISFTGLAGIPEQGFYVTGGHLSLVQRAREGDRGAFLQLFEKHGKTIYSLSLRLARDITVAEELTRDIFIEAFSDLSQVGDDEGFVRRLSCSACKIIRTRHSDESSVFAGGPG